MRYLILFVLTTVIDMSACSVSATNHSYAAHSSTLLSRKQVTVHNCDSAGEALAEAESRNPGWTAYNARNVGGRTWVVSMKQS